MGIVLELFNLKFLILGVLSLLNLGSLSYGDSNTAFPGHADVGLTLTQIKELVDLHNEKKRNPANDGTQASNMEAYIWDEELANIAKLLADKCDYSNQWDKSGTSYDGVQLGQNLGHSKKDSVSSPHVHAVNGWFGELSDYSYADNSCQGTCKNYNQVVWAKSNRVGCAKNFCPTLQGVSIGNVDFIVCNYYTAGSVAGQKPYIQGSSCSACDADTCSADGKLCMASEVEDCFEKCGNAGLCSRRCIDGNCDNTQCLCEGGSSDCAENGVRVDRIEPNKGSINGATRMTIRGKGFGVADIFDYSNTVEFVSDSQTYECIIDKDGSDENDIMCETSAMPPGNYYVRVSINGLVIPDERLCNGNPKADACKLETRIDKTPTIDLVKTWAVPQRSLIEMEGEIITDMYGSNLPEATNTRKEKIKRVYAQQKCELVNETSGQFYGLALASTTTIKGKIVCQLQGKFIGHMNTSFIVDGEFGRSKPKTETLRVSSTNKIFMVQTFAEVTDVSPSVGSPVGGTRLTINGTNFDNSSIPARVEVGGAPCKILQVDDNTIVCQAPDEQPSSVKYSGGRGALYEQWSGKQIGSFNDLATISDLTDADDGYTSNAIDPMYFNELNEDGFATRTTAYFVPPRTTQYQFYIKSDDMSALYMSPDDDPSNKTRIAYSDAVSTTYTSRPNGVQSSAVMDLEAGKRYYLEALHQDHISAESLSVAVKMYEGEYTKEQTFQAVHERQHVDLKSTVDPEIQSIELQNWATQSAVSEVQSITFEFDDNVVSGNLRIGFLGTFTDLLSTGDSASDFETALNELPTIYPDTVSVSASIGGGFTVIFNTDRGDLPLLEYKENSSRVIVTEVTKGVPSLENYYLTFEGIVSDAISTTATTDQIAKAIENMFSIVCPQEVLSVAQNTLQIEYEDPSDPNIKTGSVVQDEEPFCGKSSLKNPHLLYRDKESGFNPEQFKHLCFAYRGDIRGFWVLTSYYLDSELKKTQAWVDVEASSRWVYTCQTLTKELINVPREGWNLRVTHLYAVSKDNQDFFIDTLSISKAKPTNDIEGIVSKRRLPPRVDRFQMGTITVSGSGESYSVTMSPNNCENDFPLLSVFGATATSGSLDSDAVTLGGDDWPSNVAVSVTRQQRASPPVLGAFSLTYKDTVLTNIPVDSDAEYLQSLLQTAEGIGQVSVSRSGVCSDYSWQIDWLSAGNQPELEVDYSGVSGHNATLEMRTSRDGGTLFDPIPGDMLRRVESQPQVVVYINNLPSACVGDCSYTWSDSVLPTITAVSPSSGSDNTAITISGTKFNTDKDMNEVMIGGTPCTISSASATEIKCTVGEGTAGSHLVVVNNLEMGFAKHVNGDVMFTYAWEITAISPSVGSVGGCTLLTVNGTGFAANSNVTLGDSLCEITSLTYNQLQCITPPNLPGEYDVVMSYDGDTTSSPTKFTYDASSTPNVTSISSDTGLVEGGSVLDITGEGFGAQALSDSAVTLGGVPAAIVHYNDTHIQVELPSLAPGVYPLKIEVQGAGCADLVQNNISQISYKLKVTGMSPNYGSQFGGTMVSLRGEGFSLDKDVNQVSIGDANCEVQSSSDNLLTCVTKVTGKTHVVVNKVSDSQATWDPPSLTIKAGDTVRWSWNTPPSVSGLAYGVQETEEAGSKTGKEGGFASPGPKTANGAFEYMFTTPGTFYYWSNGAVDNVGAWILRGAVRVLPKQNSAGYVTVSINGHEAEYDTSQNASISSNADCPNAHDPRSGCSALKPSQNNSNGDMFEFAFWECSTAQITDISRNVVTSADEIVFTGIGFSDELCEDEVTVGDYNCNVTSANETRIVCKVDSNGTMPVGLPIRYQISVHNRGLAVNMLKTDLDRHIILTPRIHSISPQTGSTAGGTLITITGDGFDGDAKDMTVTIGSYVQCEVTQVSYSEVVCRTKAYIDYVANLSLTVSAHGNDLLAECEGLKCKFNMSSEFTPCVTSVTPSVVSGDNTPLTITGDNFGSDPNAIEVVLGDTQCAVDSVSDSEIICNMSFVDVGSQEFYVRVKGAGNAKSSINALVSNATIESVVPSKGSIHGGQEITITGNGFKQDNIQVTVKDVDCAVKSSTPSTIICKTPSKAGEVRYKRSAGDEDVAVVVVSNGVEYPSMQFKYEVASTPEITSINPTTGVSGDQLVISGNNFVSKPTVSIDNVECNVTDFSSSEITCTVGDHAAGSYPVMIEIDELGMGGTDVEFSYLLEVTNSNPDTGSFGGGQLITITGQGFDNKTAWVTVCNKTCSLVTGTPTEIVCEVPENNDGYSNGGSEICDVRVKVNNAMETLVDEFTYDSNLTPEITSISPTSGGTGGGTTLTINGNGFGSNIEDNEVTIAGTTCNITQASSSEIICITGAHSPTVRANVRVQVSGQGSALPTNAEYFYIDRWSSKFTWGGGPLPTDGDMVVIQEGQTILMDMDVTPVFKLVLIKGGALIFDDTMDVHFQSEVILIVNGGKLQVGTEDEPFQHEAVITLHGHLRSKELPTYGTKNIAVRGGTLDLHGIPKVMTWTRLDETAAAGSTTLKLEQPVDWKVGDEIIIATTGDKESQKESEQRTITAISNDNLTLTIDSALEYEHLGETFSYDNGEVEFHMKGEIGLLTRNVKVKGSRDLQWADEIEACPEGFSAGEFASQACFQGRFGDEIGSDQFGAHIIIHSPHKDQNLAIARISYIEMNYVGQAFRLGRYPIHFHLLGDVNFTSYVRGCAIHESFNRAVNIHGSHRVLVEHTVIYNIMGGAFFLEDGIETGNIIQYNLAVFVKQSTSLLNDDITPSAFWITNPNNTIRHNHGVGGTHFAFWYRMHEHPDGPSFTEDVCPKKIPVAEFYNNTGHSVGMFAIWIFPEYFPMEGGSCDSKIPAAAKFDTFTSWHCEKGAEWVNAGAMQFNNFMVAENEKSNIEMKRIIGAHNFDAERGAVINNSVLIGHTRDGARSTKYGFILPLDRGLVVHNTKFINFVGDNACFGGIAIIICRCDDYCGGFESRYRNIKYINAADNKASFKWEHEVLLIDEDGSLSGTAGGVVTPYNPSLPSYCTQKDEWGVKLPGAVCPSGTIFRRFSFHKATPRSLWFKNVLLTSDYGTSVVPWAKLRMSHHEGWMLTMVSGLTYNMIFEGADHITNFSYIGTHHDYAEGDFIILTHNLTQKPDRFKILRREESPDEGQSAALSYELNENGDWFFDSNTKTVSYIISGKGDQGKGVLEPGRRSTDVRFSVYRCFYQDCLPPPDPNSMPPARERPAVFQKWSEGAYWAPAQWDDGSGNQFYVSQVGSNRRKREAGVLPPDGSNIKISGDTWLVADTALPKMNRLYIYGVLELDGDANPDGSYKDFTIEATYIFIQGGRLIIGWPDQPFFGMVTIILHGNHQTPDMPLPNGPNMGSKFIGAFGGLDLHGKDHSYTWTKLSSTANVGDNSITVADPVDWEVGDDIVVITTDLTSRNSEIFKITSVSDKTLGLNATMQHKHVVVSESFANGQSYEMAAEVGLLTRNIKIIGGDYAELANEMFGARVIIGRFAQGGTIYRGYARVTNVEFYRGGQEGWVDSYDPRYAIAWVSAGTSDAMKPSYISKCAFHSGYNTAIGVFGTNNLAVKDNVIHYTIGAGIQADGANLTLEHNLVSAAMWIGTVAGRYEKENFDFHAGIEVNLATNVLLKNNHVGGVERFAYRIAGQPCEGHPNNIEAWSGNVAHSALTGVAMIFDLEDCTVEKNGGCTKIAGFTIYKTYDYGIYHQTECSVEAEDLTMIDNRLGFFSIVIKPSAEKHMMSDKYVNLKNSLFVGHTSAFDCDEKLDNEDNFELSDQARAEFGKAIGITMTSFYSKDNGATFKPFADSMAPHAISGTMRVHDVTLANFGSLCGTRSYVFTDNAKNPDTMHPVLIEKVTMYNVDKESIALIHRPDIGGINEADCIDMDCDGQKKAMLKDNDGTLLGSIGAVIPDSGFEWGGDPKRGLGDYRIPKTMYTDTDGNRLDVSVLMPHKGIIGTGDSNTCTYMDAWQAYECHGLNYEMMMIESLDKDSMMRRLSPVAVLGDQTIDLINGPEDHSWCHGYTCHMRLATYTALVATDKEYEIHYTSTSPQSTRFILHNCGHDEVVKLAVWYSNPQRLAVYVDGEYIVPLNVEENEEGKEIFKGPTFEGEYMPDISGVNGANFFDRDTGLLHFVVRGSNPVVIRTLPVIMVSFNMPALTEDEFFGENIVSNLALFLEIPPEKIRIVNIVSEQSGRRKRAVSGVMKVEVEIGNKPSNDNSSLEVPAANSSNPVSLAPGDLDLAKLQNATAMIINAVQLGSLSDILNVTVLSVSVIEPAPDTSSPEWGEMANKSDVSVAIKVPARLELVSQILGTAEGRALPTQPVLYMYDQDGDLVTQLGSISSPWEVTASIRANSGSDPRADVGGLASVPFEDGIATFTDLSISHSGSGYIIDFMVTNPAEASGFKVSSPALTITEAPLKLGLVNVPSTAYSGQTTSVTIEVQNADTGIALPDVEWKGHTWSASVSLYPANSNIATLYGTKTMDFNGSGLEFDNLMLVHNLTQPYSVFLKIATTTVPSDSRYSLTAISQVIDVYPMNYTAPAVEKNSTVQLTFNADYDSIASGSEKYLSAHIKNHFQQKYPDVLIGIPTLAKGSILATFYVAGPMEKWNSTLIGMYEDLKSGLTLTFNGQSLTADKSMLVDSEPYYGLDGGPIPIEADTGLDTAIIIVIIVVPVLVIAIVLVIVVVVIKKGSAKVVPSTESSPCPSAGRPRSKFSYTAPEVIPCTAPDTTSWGNLRNAVEQDGQHLDDGQEGTSNSMQTVHV